MIRLMVILGIGFAVIKLGPKSASSLFGDTLKLEWIRELQGRHKERQSKEIPSIESIERRFAVRVFAACASIFGAAWVGMGIGVWGLILGILLSVGYAVICFRITRHKRRVVWPLYLTLCRMQGSRWDAHGDPSRWLRVPRSNDRPIRLLLPRDWHATGMGVKVVDDIVRQRVVGEWKMRIDRPRFLMTWIPTAASSVDVGEIGVMDETQEDSLGIGVEPIPPSEVDEIVPEISFGKGPW